MPGTTWSAPASTVLNSASLVTSSFVTATPTDISPGQCPVPAGALNVGTRVRITAAGSYIATTTASSITWSIYMNAPGTAFATTPAILSITPAIPCVAISGITWIVQYWGHMAAISTVGGTAASIVGHGTCFTGLTGLTNAGQVTPMPVTVAGMTVAQAATGMVTFNSQNVYIVATITTNTGLTSITTDELTCELLG